MENVSKNTIKTTIPKIKDAYLSRATNLSWVVRDSITHQIVVENQERTIAETEARLKGFIIRR
jgi:hypothetical protein